MKFFFDNNLSPYLAHGIRELSKISPGVDEVVHLSDRFERDAKDLVWIPGLGEDGPWYIVSLDRYKKQHGAEREALRRAGHTVFVLDVQWTKHRFWLQAERFVSWWPQIVDHAGRVSGGAYRVPWAHSSQSKFQAIRF